MEINNLPVTVINCRFIKPLDYKMLEELVQRNVKFISYESDLKEHGLAAMILEWCNDQQHNIHIKRFAIEDMYVEQGSERLLRKDLHIDMNSLLDYIEKEI